METIDQTGVAAQPEKSDARQNSEDSVAFLLRRMQESSDFPVLSESIRSLNQLACSNEKDAASLASIIIRDFALTNKILKVVNSAYYSGFAGKIGSVSRAIVVLGIKTIRSIAASLIFFEHLHDKAQASRLKDQISSAVFGATLSRQLARHAGTEDVEASFLCGMLHNLGSILITYYLPEESEEIEHLVIQDRMLPEAAQQRVLGMSFEQTGIAIARHWNFPPEITDNMVKIDPAAPGDVRKQNIKLRFRASLANDAAMLIGHADSSQEDICRDLLRRYRKGLEIGSRQFTQIVAEAREEFRELSIGLDMDGFESRFLQRLVGGARPDSPSDAGPGEKLAGTLLLTPQGDDYEEPVPADNANGRPSPDAQLIMAEGLREVSEILAEESCNLSQVFNVVLETLYRAMGFRHVVLCLHDVRQQLFIARLGFGVEIEQFMSDFRFSSRYRPDAFNAALKNSVDLYIDNARDQQIQGNIPDWYNEISSAGSFIIFPVVVDRRPLGLIYADHSTPQAMQLNGNNLNLMKALRNQVVMALRARA